MKRFLCLSLFCTLCFSSSELFPLYKEIEPNVNFWISIYSKHDTNQIIFTDSEDLSIIYDVIEVPPVGNKNRQVLIEAKRKEIQASLHNGRAEYVRAQNGLKDRFLEGLILSGAHESAILEQLASHELPKELIAVIFVESLFYLMARSSAGAAGPWQILKSTAKEHAIRVNELVDERYDPFLSTEAAILYLKKSYSLLNQSWPVSITSYNYGRAGIKRALEELQSNDYVYLIKNYQKPRFGFAAKNYYSEFLAALHVYQNYKVYFGEVERQKPWKYDVLEIPKPIFAKDLQMKNGFFTYNPALTKQVKNNQQALPDGFRIRVPLEEKAHLEKRFEKLPARTQLKSRVHRVTHAQPLSKIAKTYDVFVEKLAKRLGLTPTDKVPKGKVIRIHAQDQQFSPLPFTLISN